MLISLELFVMLVLANGVPVVAARVFGRRWSAPVDGGRLWRDGRPLLGNSKTWRGVVSGMLACGLFALIIGMGLLFGLVFGLLGLIGDMISSFIKRRAGLDSSARALGLDQIPEALLPMILAWYWLELNGLVVAGVVALFTVSNIVLSPLLFRLGIRHQPH
ncbi:CDP-archaeol synthase [Marinobacter panjinensis]|uniref:CDP-archaeol synthase n=1 Tax=Marinobacter panjinensis TaxID=2576384 RepID=A0A4U6R7S5_9GAMM|nr:CDP-archaeol synthase [Marinobacter panjinensis]MCR8916161.1 CDP-archaeol synthase [Marinobacter panjinensis]TKV68366.1 CDP-archaeol synthase [Marinobacter panjinensis]